MMMKEYEVVRVIILLPFWRLYETFKDGCDFIFVLPAAGLSSAMADDHTTRFWIAIFDKVLPCHCSSWWNQRQNLFRALVLALVILNMMNSINGIIADMQEPSFGYSRVIASV